MSAAILAPPATETEADRQAEGWRLGHRACRYVVWSLEGELDKPAARAALALAIQKIDAIEAPSCVVVLPRAERLTATIRAAIALSGVGLAPEALAILKDALQ